MSFDQLSVIMPTRNCRHLIEPVVGILQQWLSKAGEVIVVDSNSEDGTLELLRESFPYPNVRFINRPPGLYAAWNHGIQMASRPMTYIATAGDAITESEIATLISTFIQLDVEVDVVVAPPLFVDKSYQPVTGPKWPCHALWHENEHRNIVLLSGLELAAFALKHARPPFYDNWLCSSASNVYRTSYLQTHPFPEDAGHTGDTLFGIRNARFMKAAFCRQPCGSFVLHDVSAFAHQFTQAQSFEHYYLGAYRQELEWLIDQHSPNCSAYYKDLFLDPEPTRKHVEWFDIIQQLAVPAGGIENHIARHAKLEQKVLQLKDTNAKLKEQLAQLKEIRKQDKLVLQKIHRRIPKWLRRCFGLS